MNVRGSSLGFLTTHGDDDSLYGTDKKREQ